MMSRLHRLCLVAYVAFRLMHVALFSVLAKYLVSTDHPDAKPYKRTAASLELLKLTHLAATCALPALVTPRRLPALFAGTTALFAVVFGASAYAAIGGRPAAVVAVLRGVLGPLLCVCLVAIDAALDALCRARSLYLEPVKKASAIACAVALLAQTHLIARTPDCPWGPVPLLALGGAAVAAGLWACGCAVDVAPGELALHVRAPAAGPAKEERSQQSQKGAAVVVMALPPAAAALFALTSAVGDNGEQLLDTTTNYKIDAELAGGKVAAFTAMTLVKLCAHVVTGTIFWRTYTFRFGGGKKKEKQADGNNSAGIVREVRVAFIGIGCWAAFQMVRLVALRWPFGGGATGAASVAALVMADKLTGTLGQDAFGALQSLALPILATRAVAVSSDGGGGTWSWWRPLAVGVALTPNLLGSFAEVARKISKGLVKTALLDEASLLSTHTGAVCCACVAFACVAHAALGRVVLARHQSADRRGRERAKQV